MNQQDTPAVALQLTSVSGHPMIIFPHQISAIMEAPPPRADVRIQTIVFVTGDKPMPVRETIETIFGMFPWDVEVRAAKKDDDPDQSRLVYPADNSSEENQQ